MPGATTESASSTIPPVVVHKVSRDETYGYRKRNPMRVVGGRSAGMRNMLRSLKGLQGQVVKYKRQASRRPPKPGGAWWTPWLKLMGMR